MSLKKTAGVSEYVRSVCVSVCACLSSGCRGPNGFQKESHNKRGGNQTVGIMTHSKHRTENMPAGLLSINDPVTQLENKYSCCSA